MTFSTSRTRRRRRSGRSSREPAGRSRWQSTKADGWISIATAASASDYQCFFTQEPHFFLPAVAGYVAGWEAYLNVTEAATNASSWFAGFTSTTTTGFLSSGVPPSSYSGAVIYKTTGSGSQGPDQQFDHTKHQRDGDHDRGQRNQSDSGHGH